MTVAVVDGEALPLLAVDVESPAELLHEVPRRKVRVVVAVENLGPESGEPVGPLVHAIPPHPWSAAGSGTGGAGRSGPRARARTCAGLPAPPAGRSWRSARPSRRPGRRGIPSY